MPFVPEDVRQFCRRQMLVIRGTGSGRPSISSALHQLPEANELYLYHLDAMEDPFHPGYPQDLKDKCGPRKSQGT